LIRSLLASFEMAGGVPLRVAFDNPRTVVIRHAKFRDPGLEMRVVRRAQREDLDTEACLFVSQQFRDDECLGKPRVALHDISDARRFDLRHELIRPDCGTVVPIAANPV